MKIAIVSDTHARGPAGLSSFESFLFENNIDTIIHCGDWEISEYYEYLASMMTVHTVLGNCDDFYLAARLAKKLIVDIDGVKIGIIHGDGVGRTTRLRAYYAFSDDQVDMICYGHSHVPEITNEDGVFLVNPGSLSRPRGEVKLPSCILLDIQDGKIEDIKLHYLEK